MEMFSLCSAQYGRPYSQEVTKNLKCDQGKWGTDFLILFNVYEFKI